MPGQTPIHSRVLCIDGDLAAQPTAGSRRIRAIVDALRERGVEVIESLSYDDGVANVVSDSAIHCVLVDWALGTNDDASHAAGTELLRTVRKRNASVPIFLLADRSIAGQVTVEVASLADEFIWTLQDDPDFIARRVAGGGAPLLRHAAAALRARAGRLQPRCRVLVGRAGAPGRRGLQQVADRPHLPRLPTARTLFRTDMGIERGALGSLLSHTGPIGESEAYIARVFGAHRSYSVLNGTSGSNRTIMSACVGRPADRAVRPQLPQVDRAGPGHDRRHPGVPAVPGATATASSGRSTPTRLAPAAIAAKIAANPLARQAPSQRAGLRASITNSTYDGMCYDADGAQDLLARQRRPHPLRRGLVRLRALQPDVPRPLRHARRRQAATTDGPTVFATHSTHKLLAALSQASYIHVRDGRGADRRTTASTRRS